MNDKPLFIILLIQLVFAAGVFAQEAEIPEPRTEVQINTSFESLTNGYGDWRTVSLDLSRRFRSGRVVYGSLLATERFGGGDQQGTFGFYQPLSKTWTLQVEASASPSHRTLSKWTAFAGIERRFSKGWNVNGGYRRTAYRAEKVNLANAGVEKYFGNYRAAYTLYVSNLASGGTSSSHRFQFNRYYGEHASSIGASGGFGREIESLGAGTVLQTSVAGAGVSGRHWFNGRWGVNYDASLTRQGSYYIRRGLNLGFRYRF